MDRLNAQQLRTQLPNEQLKKNIKKNPVYIILDSVFDTYNVGAIFRLADAVAAKKVFLCGQTEIPPNTRIKKASINTTEWVEWEYCESPVEVIRNLQFTIYNLQIVAIEQTPIESGQGKKSVQYDKFAYTLPLCLIVGNETTGVSKETLDLCDGVVELPMFGVNISLNVV